MCCQRVRCFCFDNFVSAPSAGQLSLAFSIPLLEGTSKGMAVRKGTRLLQQVGLTQANSSKFGRFVEAVLHFSCNLILFSGFGPGEVSSPRPVHWAGTQVEPANTSYFVSSWKRKLRLNPTSMENSCIISKSGVQFSCRPTFTERGGLPRDPGVRGHIFKFQRKQRSNFFLRLTVQNCAGHISPEEQGN